MGPRKNLDGEDVAPLKICIIGAGGFIGSHLCEALMWETEHSVISIDVYSDKIDHLLRNNDPWSSRIEFHKMNIKHDPRMEGLVREADMTINLAAICTPADYNTRPLDTIYSNFIDAIPVVKFCSDFNKRLIHFSTCEVYGKTIGNYLPKDSPLRQDPAFYVLKEDSTPCIYGSVEKQRWSYACAKQLIERLIYGEGAENGLNFTIVRPFNWIGPRMDFIPGIDGPADGVPRVLACFSTENPQRVNGQIFNVGNPHNEATVKELAEMMTDIYCGVSGEAMLEAPIVDVTSREFYGEGYDDSDKRIPDMTIIHRQLGWEPSTPLRVLLEVTLRYQHTTYARSVKASMAQVHAQPQTALRTL